MEVLGRSINSNRSFLLGIRKNIIPIRAVEHWRKLLREMGEYLCSPDPSEQSPVQPVQREPCFEQKI